MAATITKLNPETNAIKYDHGAGLKVSLLKLAGDNSYPTGGYALAASDFGFSGLVAVAPFGHPNGYLPEYDYTNSKLKLRWCAGAGAVASEVTNATDVSAATFYLLGFGF